MAEDLLGEQAAQRYDAAVGDMFAIDIVETAVALLAQLAGAGAALELGEYDVATQRLGRSGRR